MQTTTLETLDIIGFSYNWNNKLQCKAFTTLRMSNPKKYVEGREYWVRLKDEIKSKATIRAVSHFKLEGINDFISYLDTGYNANECKKILQRMYSKVDFSKHSISLILLEQIERVERKLDPAGVECFEYFEIQPWKV
jgi:hypothetical protein